MYYVLYEYYTEYNQFEGTWEKDWAKFDSLPKALQFKAKIGTNSNYRNIQTVLTEV